MYAVCRIKPTVLRTFRRLLQSGRRCDRCDLVGDPVTLTAPVRQPGTGCRDFHLARSTRLYHCDLLICRLRPADLRTRRRLAASLMTYVERKAKEDIEYLNLEYIQPRCGTTIHRALVLVTSRSSELRHSCSPSRYPSTSKPYCSSLVRALSRSSSRNSLTNRGSNTHASTLRSSICAWRSRSSP